MPVSQPTVEQPQTSQLARRWRLDVDLADSSTAPNWVQVRGMQKFTPNTRRR